MSITWLPCVLLCLTGAQDDSLKLTDPHGTYGYLGATRPKAGILPGDMLHFSFAIKNMTFDSNGKAAYSIAIEIRDAAGRIFYEQKPYNAVAQNYLGGKLLPCSGFVEVPLDAKPGPVTWKITVRDRITKKSVVAHGKGKILPPGFGIVQVGLFADVDAQAPMSPNATVGGSAYLKFSTVGFSRDKESKQPNVNFSLRILDEQGKPTLAKPITGKINAGVAAQERHLTSQFGLTFDRAGRFTIELTAEDVITGLRSQVKYKIRTHPLE
ncbi:MAG: hypothetical protein HYX68_27485 [Planctomycetes bacterium]|jgi:hypothetical protein|nr:hypothetical protein [Planctomycetota bacterium]